MYMCGSMPNICFTCLTRIESANYCHINFYWGTTYLTPIGANATSWRLFDQIWCFFYKEHSFPIRLSSFSPLTIDNKRFILHINLWCNTAFHVFLTKFRVAVQSRDNVTRNAVQGDNMTFFTRYNPKVRHFYSTNVYYLMNFRGTTPPRSWLLLVSRFFLGSLYT